MKASIKVLKNGNVQLSYDSLLTGEREVEIYSCPAAGGYVRDEKGRQVCERLAIRGNTLMSKTREDLADVIRKEYRKFKADLIKRLG